MVEKDMISTLKEPESLIANEYYFKFIFKKTEKIVCAVFLILSDIKKNSAESTLVNDLEKEALGVLSFVGETLSRREGEKQEAARRLIHKLVLLESKLRVLHAVGQLSGVHLNVFVAEIDAAIRSARGLETENPERQERSVTAGSVLRAPRIPTRMPSIPKQMVRGVTEDRKERISVVLRAQPGASIKDISDTIKDCSEKTIQRELNDMIRDGFVVRKGEKRWSKYFLSS